VKEKWRKLNDEGLTLAQLFKDALHPESKKFNLEKTLQKKVSDVSAAATIDLLPSSLDLIDIQDELINTPVGKYGAIRPFDILWRATKDLIEDYDIVIIDCPPNLGKITQNGLRMSQGFVIPTIPDRLSTYGIPQIVRRVRELDGEIRSDPDRLAQPAGLCRQASWYVTDEHHRLTDAIRTLLSGRHHGWVQTNAILRSLDSIFAQDNSRQVPTSVQGQPRELLHGNSPKR
jgi:hypothetical protein